MSQVTQARYKLICARYHYPCSRSVIMLFISSLLLSFILIDVHQGSALILKGSNETSRSGEPGCEVRYTIEVQNDEPYPVDVLATVENSSWEARIIKNEFIRVLPLASVSFEVVVLIPTFPEQDNCTTKINLYEKPSEQGLLSYRHELSLMLRTSLVDCGSEDDYRDLLVTKSHTNDIILPVLVFSCGIILMTALIKSNSGNNRKRSSENGKKAKK